MSAGQPRNRRSQRRRDAVRGLLAGVAVLLTGATTLHPVAQIVAMRHATGQNVTPVFEGWYKTPDGRIAISFGYMNRNFEERLDIPVGPNNRLDPGPPDQDQPTHFLPRRHFGVFTILVPKGLVDQTVTWSLTAHGKTASIPASLKPIWEISPLKDSTANNTPPIVRFKMNRAGGQGPRGVTTSAEAVVNHKLPLTAWVTDDGVVSLQQSGRAPRLTVRWSKYRGPGVITFENAMPQIGADNKVSTWATFDTPGDYVLRLLANDYSGDGGGGTQCCWTNGYVKVSVLSRPLASEKSDARSR